MTEVADTPALPALDQFQRWSDLIGRGQQTMLEFMTREAAPANPDPFGMLATWQKVAAAAAADPQKIAAMQTRFMTDSLALWQSFLTPGASSETKPDVRDKRFKDAAWAELPAFDLMRQSYLLASKYVLETTAGLDGLDEHDKAKALFHARQFVDALSPSNYPLTNPEVLKATIETKGENLLKGLDHLLDDLKAGRMRMTDETAFEVGRNVAVTPGKVVFENRLFQLIQYAPTTPDVYATPLLIFPPWINKFYILDLTPEKSFIRWAVEQGLTVFIVSWKNADASLADVTLDNYVGEGMVMAIAKTLEATGAERTHAIGYCVAGTTLAATLAYLTAKGQADKVATATFFTAQVDFADCGDLSVFVDDEQIEGVAKMTEGKGYLPGAAMATTFNMLRSNDLIWNYVVNNYMLGKDYLPFDLLYWNSDATNVPAQWHKAYLEDMYRDNKLIVPGGISVAGVPIDLSTVMTPSYIQGGKEDHIAPARSAYRITQAFGGPVRFVLAGSGHIAGVVNPPSQHKYQYWTNDALPAAFAEFVAGATEHKGSWWPDWIVWLSAQSSDKVPARVPGEGPLKAIEDAPGRYVKERA
ncbi:class I poly(R)-hydroxyalkanoic acid synthase [Sphingosinicellaceae bacterium]|nr:class I poly(R)-hydroxyalkanoic acid synthase [Sphingosinicellaceae bacterium]